MYFIQLFHDSLGSPNLFSMTLFSVSVGDSNTEMKNFTWSIIKQLSEMCFSYMYWYLYFQRMFLHVVMIPYYVSLINIRNYLTHFLWNCTNSYEKAVRVAKMASYPNFVIHVASMHCSHFSPLSNSLLQHADLKHHYHVSVMSLWVLVRFGCSRCQDLSACVFWHHSMCAM